MLYEARYFTGVQACDGVIVHGCVLVSNMTGASCDLFITFKPLALSAGGGCVEMGKMREARY